MYPSRVVGYQVPLSLKAFFSNPYVSLSSFIKLVAKVKIFIKLIMYVLSHGCLLNLYKAFFHLHTWLCMSCDFTCSGCKCLFVAYALYPTMFPSTAWWNYELPFTYRYCILGIILLELLHSWKVLYSSYYYSSWTVVTCSSKQVSSLFSCRRLYVIFPKSQI